MSASLRGEIRRCAFCGAEVTVLARRCGVFAPVCCDRPMLTLERRAEFWFCPVCSSELAAVAPRPVSAFQPVCCDRPMVREIASAP